MRRRGVLLAAAAAAVAVLAADAATVGVRAGDRSPSVALLRPASLRLDLVGQVVLGSSFGGTAADFQATAAGCTGAGAFGGVVAGATVTVQAAASGSTLATVPLAAGRVVTTAGRPTCAFGFRVLALAVAPAYVLTVTSLKPVSRGYGDLATGVLEIDASA